MCGSYLCVKLLDVGFQMMRTFIFRLWRPIQGPRSYCNAHSPLWRMDVRAHEVQPIWLATACTRIFVKTTRLVVISAADVALPRYCWDPKRLPSGVYRCSLMFGGDLTGVTKRTYADWSHSSCGASVITRVLMGLRRDPFVVTCFCFDSHDCLCAHALVVSVHLGHLICSGIIADAHLSVPIELMGSDAPSFIPTTFFVTLTHYARFGILFWHLMSLGHVRFWARVRWLVYHMYAKWKRGSLLLPLLSWQWW